MDAAFPGDTVFVKNGIYYEDVVINKTLNLTGEDKDNTIINATNIGISVDSIEYVNISRFTIENGSNAGVALLNSNNSLIENNRIINNNYGIKLFNSNNTKIKNNNASYNANYYGIYLFGSKNSMIANNICNENRGSGIYIQDSRKNIIFGNNCSNNYDGITLGALARGNIVEKNNVKLNSGYGIGIFANNNTLMENIIDMNEVGIKTNALVGETNKLINSSIINSISHDIFMGFADNLISLNSSFDKSKISFKDIDSTLFVQWYVQINIVDYLGNPVPDAIVKIEDNLNGSNNFSYISDSEGKVYWIPINEYYEQDITGDTIGEKTYLTPHRIVAWNNTLVGYAFPEPNIDKSKTINIIIYNGTLVEIENIDWNFVSIPRIQVDTNIEKVLQSIGGRYNAVQWYDVTDTNDNWKHYHVSKPASMNDLKELDHTMGFWLDITDSQGTTLVVFGDELVINQTITLFPGWNLVGYPSKLNRQRNTALNNVKFGNDIDKIERFNSTTGLIEEVLETDFLKIGQSYWIHSKVEIIWYVPR